MYGNNKESLNSRNVNVTTNKGLNSRQLPIYERPLSNYTTGKYETERKKPILMQFKQQPSAARDSVKFDTQRDKKNDNFIARNIPQEQIRKVSYYTAQDKKLYDSLANDDLYNSCMDSEIDSVYSSSFYHDDDNESEIESLYDPNDYTRRTLHRMETRVNTITNRFLNKVKSQVDETFSKLKLQSKLNNVKSKKVPKKDEGCGDSKKPMLSVEEDAMIKKILKVKMDCYEKIDNNLKVLQQVDRLTEELYKNHIGDAKQQ